MKKRVVVTGMGAITPVGLNVNDFWKSIKDGVHGFGRITRFDASEYKAKLVAEVKGFVAKEHMDFKAAKRMDLFSQYAVAAAKEAFSDADIHMEEEDPYRIGVCVGTGIGGLPEMEREYERLLSKGPGKVGPLFVPKMIGNIASGNISIQMGLKGKTLDVVSACTTGTNSIGESFRTIQYGDADIMVSGGTESTICPLGVSGFTALTALSGSEDPDRCSIPFDKDRDGFVMGEGAGVVILEELEHAKKRGAKIYAELVGYGCSSDAYHITSPAEDGEGAAKAMENAIRDAGIEKEDVFYINAHGTGTHYNDLFETRAIKLLFGEHAKKIKINSTKSMIGHLLGAAGAVEFITCVKELQEGYIHQTLGLRETEEEMDLDYCKEAVEMPIQYALSNSLGFGGHNGSLLVKKWDE